MTTSTVWIDGWPYRISFTGTIEVARMWQSERARLFSEENTKAFAPVAIRGLTDDAIVTVEVDQAVLKANREAVCKAFAEERMFRAFLAKIVDDEPIEHVRAQSDIEGAPV